MGLAARSLVERFSQRRDVDPDRVLVDNQSGPNPGHQLVFGDHFALRHDKRAKDIERAAAERYRHAVTCQLALAEIKAKSAKADLVPNHHLQPQWPPIKNN